MHHTHQSFIKNGIIHTILKINMATNVGLSFISNKHITKIAGHLSKRIDVL